MNESSLLIAESGELQNLNERFSALTVQVSVPALVQYSRRKGDRPMFQRIIPVGTKSTLRIVLCVTICAAVAICGMPKSAHADDAATVADGLKRWQDVKQSCFGNYQYTVTYSSFSGLRSSTVITVRNNKVSGRKFQKSSGRPVLPTVENTNEQGWEESSDAIGTDTEGAPAMTLDEIYATASEIASRQLAAHEKRYVHLDKQGLIKSCFIVNTMIMDDAPIDGINLAMIQIASKTTEAIESKSPADPQAVANLKHFATNIDGLTRHVILLPHKEREMDHDYRVELIVGQTIQTDGVNKYRLMGQIDEQTLNGIGYQYYLVSKIQGALSTKIGVPAGQKPVNEFVEIPRRLVPYNSRLPIVIYAPADADVKYRIFEAGPTMPTERG